MEAGPEMALPFLFLSGIITAKINLPPQDLGASDKSGRKTNFPLGSKEFLPKL
jgi:hypothetical protein